MRKYERSEISGEEGLLIYSRAAYRVIGQYEAKAVNRRYYPMGYPKLLIKTIVPGVIKVTLT